MLLFDGMKAMSAALLLVLASAQTLAATLPSQMSAAETDTAAKSYMEENRVSLNVAKQRLMIESEIQPYLEQLRERYKDRLAFISIEPQPHQYVRVGLKGNTMVPTQRIKVSGTVINVEFQQGYAYTQQEFRASLQAATPKIIELIPDAISINGRPELGAIEVWVRGTDNKSYLRATEQIEKATGLKVEIVLGTGRPGRAALPAKPGPQQAMDRRAGG